MTKREIALLASYGILAGWCSGYLLFESFAPDEIFYGPEEPDRSGWLALTTGVTAACTVAFGHLLPRRRARLGRELRQGAVAGGLAGMTAGFLAGLAFGPVVDGAGLPLSQNLSRSGGFMLNMSVSFGAIFGGVLGALHSLVVRPLLLLPKEPPDDVAADAVGTS